MAPLPAGATIDDHGEALARAIEWILQMTPHPCTPRRPRRPIRLPLLLREGAGNGAAGLGSTADMSDQGLGFLSPGPLTAGQQIELGVMVPSHPAAIELLVQVRWCRRDTQGDGHQLPYRCGARIVAVGVRDALYLRDYLARPRPPDASRSP